MICHHEGHLTPSYKYSTIHRHLDKEKMKMKMIMKMKIKLKWTRNTAAHFGY